MACANNGCCWCNLCQVERLKRFQGVPLGVLIGRFNLHSVREDRCMDQLFEVSFSSLAESGKPFSRCGKCRRYMKYIIAKPARLYCQNCDETMVLPQTGNIKLHQELRCPLDDYELLNCSAGAKGKSFIFCPYCYSNPPFPGLCFKIDSCGISQWCLDEKGGIFPLEFLIIVFHASFFVAFTQLFL